MNINKSSESPRKVELTPLIDVIFLLLIFFLVSLNAFNPNPSQGRAEGKHTVPKLDAVHRSRGEVFFYFYQTAGSIKNFVILNESNPGGGAPLNTLAAPWNDFLNGLGGGNFINQLSNLRFRTRVNPNQAWLSHNLRNRTILLICNHDLPFEAVNQVMDEIYEAGAATIVLFPEDPANFFGNCGTISSRTTREYR